MRVEEREKMVIRILCSRWSLQEKGERERENTADLGFGRGTKGVNKTKQNKKKNWNMKMPLVHPKKAFVY